MESPFTAVCDPDPPAWEDLRVEDAGVPPLDARLYGTRIRGSGMPLVLHLHGGAFVAGGIPAGQTVAALLARAGARVLSLDYPLAPQHPFPQALESGYAVLLWLQRQRARLAGAHSPLFVAGEEAGGNLAAALALMSRDRQDPLLAGQILVAPMLDPMLGTCSMREAGAGVTGCPWAEGWRRYLCRATDATHPYAAPAGAARLAQLPAALLVSSTADPLRDEAHSFGQRLRQAGVPVDEAMLAAADWPRVLQRADAVDPPWAAELCEHFAAFFSARLNALSQQ